MKDCHRNNVKSIDFSEVWVWSKHQVIRFYARKQRLLLAHISHRNSVSPSVCLFVRLSVCHMSGSVKNGAS